MKELWTVEWSGSQQCFHVDTLEKTLSQNLQAYAEGRVNDYQILGIVKSQADAHKFADSLKQEVKKAA